MESKCSLQVPLLLKLGESKRALMSATKSGDTDLIYTVLLQLKETTQLSDFQMIVRTFSTAQNLYKKYCNLNSKSALQEIFNQEDDFVAQAEFALREGIAVNLHLLFFVFKFLTDSCHFPLTIQFHGYKQFFSHETEFKHRVIIVDGISCI